MNNGPLLFLGILVTLVSSFWGLLLAPQLQIGRQQSVLIEATGETYPQPRPGMAQQGAEVYRSLGCAACHSQQVRGFGGDRERGFGPRISVAQDSLHDYPVQLGGVRVGPDLANYGSQHTNDAAILLHLYAPQKAMPGSIMPPYRFLFETHDSTTNVVPVDGSFVQADEKKLVVPKPDALKLAAYLRSLRADAPLYEAPIIRAPQPPKNPSPAATNAPAK